MENTHGVTKKSKSTKESDCIQICPYCEKRVKSIEGHLTMLHREEVLKNHPEIELTKPCQKCDQLFFNFSDSLPVSLRPFFDLARAELSCLVSALISISSFSIGVISLGITPLTHSFCLKSWVLLYQHYHHETLRSR